MGVEFLSWWENRFFKLHARSKLSFPRLRGSRLLGLLPPYEPEILCTSPHGAQNSFSVTLFHMWRQNHRSNAPNVGAKIRNNLSENKVCTAVKSLDSYSYLINKGRQWDVHWWQQYPSYNILWKKKEDWLRVRLWVHFDLREYLTNLGLFWLNLN